MSTSGVEYFRMTPGTINDCNVPGCNGGNEGRGICARVPIGLGNFQSWCCPYKESICWGTGGNICLWHMNGTTIVNDLPSSQLMCSATNSLPYNWCCRPDIEGCPSRPMDMDGRCVAKNFTNPVRSTTIADIPIRSTMALSESQSGQSSTPTPQISPNTTSIGGIFPTSNMTLTPSPTPPPLAHSSPLPLGAAVAIGAAFVLALTVTIAVIYYLMKRKRREPPIEHKVESLAELGAGHELQPSPLELAVDYEVLAPQEIGEGDVHELGTGARSILGENTPAVGLEERGR